VTPLRIAGRDTAILVNRGFVPTPDAGYPPAGTAYREPTEARVDGPVLRVPDAGDGQPVSQPRGETWYRLDLSAIRARLPYPIAPFYLITTADSATPEHTARGRTLPIRISLPPLDNGPHLSYAIQWFLIGGAALGFGLTFGRRRSAPG
jgi:surfeit locus 1 family protein